MAVSHRPLTWGSRPPARPGCMHLPACCAATHVCFPINVSSGLNPLPRARSMPSAAAACWRWRVRQRASAAGPCASCPSWRTRQRTSRGGAAPACSTSTPCWQLCSGSAPTAQPSARAGRHEEGGSAQAVGSKCNSEALVHVGILAMNLACVSEQRPAARHHSAVTIIV